MVSRQFAVIVVSTGILAFAAAYALSGTIAKISTENKVKTSIDYAHLSSVPGSNLTLYVFTREGCRHCGDFEQMDLEAIKAAFGDRVTISVHQAPANLPIVPVSVLIGQRKELIVGRPKKTSQLLLQVESCLQQK